MSCLEASEQAIRDSSPLLRPRSTRSTCRVSSGFAPQRPRISDRNTPRCALGGADNAGFTVRPAAMGTGRELGFHRYDLMVAGFGGHGEFVDRAEDIAPAFTGRSNRGGPLWSTCVSTPRRRPGVAYSELSAPDRQPREAAGSQLRHRGLEGRQDHAHQRARDAFRRRRTGAQPG